MYFIVISIKNFIHLQLLFHFCVHRCISGNIILLNQCRFNYVGLYREYETKCVTLQWIFSEWEKGELCSNSSQVRSIHLRVNTFGKAPNVSCLPVAMSWIAEETGFCNFGWQPVYRGTKRQPTRGNISPRIQESRQTWSPKRVFKITLKLIIEHLNHIYYFYFWTLIMYFMIDVFTPRILSLSPIIWGD